MPSTRQKKSEEVLTRRRSRNPVHTLAQHAVDAILEKKGQGVVVMDMRGISGVADLFVICTGDSDVQIRAIAEAVVMRIREACDERPWHKEGLDHLQWVLLDYVDLVVHIFNPEKRTFYSLERLWGDAPVEHVNDEGSSSEVELLQAQAVSHRATEDLSAEE